MADSLMPTDHLLCPGRHRLVVALAQPAPPWQLTLFRSSLPIGGMRSPRSPRAVAGDRCDLALVVDIGRRARPFGDVAEWLWDALVAAELRPVLLSFNRPRIVARLATVTVDHAQRAAHARHRALRESRARPDTDSVYPIAEGPSTALSCVQTLDMTSPEMNVTSVETRTAER